MNIVAALVYWIIVAIWITVLSSVTYFYVTNRRAFGTTRLLLAVLALDAVRNIFENTYFGMYFGSKYGLFAPTLADVLGNPRLLIIPKLTNIGAGCIVLGLLLLRWLPEAIRERAEAKRQAEYLHELATTDSMTGLRNRGHFMVLAEAEWQRCQRYQRALSLLILDIDHFKSINDSYGHNVGDQVIMMVAKLCDIKTRVSDIAGRLGGEEFGILLLEAGINDARMLADRLREFIAGEVVTVTDNNISTTVSIGLSDAARAGSIAELFKQADVALYEAKRSGRNRVCCFAPT
jgi:diguanylate cyclase (GGDEF)-like protein